MGMSWADARKLVAVARSVDAMLYFTMVERRRIVNCGLFKQDMKRM